MSAKVVIIGAGSAIFGLKTLATLVGSPHMRGGTLGLVDLNGDGLGLVEALARRLNREWDAGLTIESSTDRKEVLPGADFVVVAIEVGPRRFACHPLRLNTQCFNFPLTEPDRRSLAQPEHLPIPLSRRRLHENLPLYHPRAFRIWIDGAEVDPSAIRSCDLSDDGGAWAHAPEDVVGFDPVLGRIATPSGDDPPERVDVLSPGGSLVMLDYDGADRLFAGEVLIPADAVTGPSVFLPVYITDAAHNRLEIEIEVELE